VRHPGNLGGFPYTVATPLLLRSLWAVVPVLATLSLMIVRRALEDNALKLELNGYREYKQF
jgi:protein-S-isoprenylcysteine O-methyltransferase Ste14